MNLDDLLVSWWSEETYINASLKHLCAKFDTANVFYDLPWELLGKTTQSPQQRHPGDQQDWSATPDAFGIFGTLSMKMSKG